MLTKPYYRIYRPFHAITKDPDQFNYLQDDRNCNYRKQLIRVYRLLESETIDIFQYIEPTNSNVNVYSLQLYHLLTKICIEVENNFKGIFEANNYSGNLNNSNIVDYFTINNHLKLNDYVIESSYFDVNIINNSPYNQWHSTAYQPLPWYQAYNSFKHNRAVNLVKATLDNVLTALAGLNILLFSQFNYFSECLSTNGVMMLYADDFENEPIIPSYHNKLFTFKTKPLWIDKDKYNFNWNNLKDSTDPFEKLNI